MTITKDFRHQKKNVGNLFDCRRSKKPKHPAFIVAQSQVGHHGQVSAMTS